VQSIICCHPVGIPVYHLVDHIFCVADGLSYVFIGFSSNQFSVSGVDSSLIKGNALGGVGESLWLNIFQDRLAISMLITLK
jgi:hypothetical protein